MRLLLCYLLCSIWHPSFLCPPLPAAAFIGFVLIKRKRLAGGAAPAPRPDKQPRRSDSAPPPPPGTLPLKEEDYAPLARGGSAMENGAAAAVAATAAAAGSVAVASREVRRVVGGQGCCAHVGSGPSYFRSVTMHWHLLLCVLALRPPALPCIFSPQASASQPPLPPALGGAPAAAAAAPEVVVHDEDDTPMPVAITADETNLFQVRHWGEVVTGSCTVHALGKQCSICPWPARSATCGL